MTLRVASTSNVLPPTPRLIANLPDAVRGSEPVVHNEVYDVASIVHSAGPDNDVLQRARHQCQVIEYRYTLARHVHVATFLIQICPAVALIGGADPAFDPPPDLRTS
jgi:hypothetical protein